MATLARLYGQDVYLILKLNPVIIAEKLKVSKEKIRSQSELYHWVVNLYFCQGDRIQPIEFCFNLVVAIGHHQTPE